MDVLVQQLKPIFFQSLGAIIAASSVLALLGPSLSGCAGLLFPLSPPPSPPSSRLPSPSASPLPPPFSFYSHNLPLLLTLPNFSSPLVSSSFLLSVCVSEGSAPITSYLERGSYSQSGFCLLLGQVISELQ